MKCDGTKHTARDRYIITACDPEFVSVQKLLGSKFRSKTYKVKPTEVYKVFSPQISLESCASYSSPYDQPTSDSDSDCDETLDPCHNSTLSQAPGQPVESPLFHTGVDVPYATPSTAPHPTRPPETNSIDSVPETLALTGRSYRPRKPPAWMTNELWQL